MRIESNRKVPQTSMKEGRGGVRQGCPLSPYIFILCTDVLGNKVRENKDTKGITVYGNEIKISQDADDTTMILDGSKKSFTST